MSYVLIPVSGGELLYAKVSVEDAVFVSREGSWARSGPADDLERNYASNKNVPMHRLIIERLNGPIAKGLVIDHINGDGLDNRRKNLRVATHQQNMWNRKPNKGCTSQYKGVYWKKNARAWAVRIRKHGKSTFLGTFATEEVAARVYDRAAAELHGKYARLNFPLEHPTHTQPNLPAPP